MMFIQVDSDADAGSRIPSSFFFSPASSFSRPERLSQKQPGIYGCDEGAGGVTGLCQEQRELVKWSLTASLGLRMLQQAIAAVSPTFTR